MSARKEDFVREITLSTCHECGKTMWRESRLAESLWTQKAVEQFLGPDAPRYGGRAADRHYCIWCNEPHRGGRAGVARGGVGRHWDESGSSFDNVIRAYEDG